MGGGGGRRGASCIAAAVLQTIDSHREGGGGSFVLAMGGSEIVHIYSKRAHAVCRRPAEIPADLLRQRAVPESTL